MSLDDYVASTWDFIIKSSKLIVKINFVNDVDITTFLKFLVILRLKKFSKCEYIFENEDILSGYYLTLQLNDIFTLLR